MQLLQHFYPLVGMFIKSQKAPNTFVMSVCPHKSAQQPLDEFP